MLEKLISLYQSYMTFGTTGLLPHLVGPPGSGKSTVVEELAELLGVELHIISVSRLSPLEVEGVQFPVGEGREMALAMLTAANWTRLKEGDIVLMDEFLRGFPEVYNALLDIFTSRRVGPFVLPDVFIIGASNSVVAYDEALEDRLLHIPVADPRKLKSEATRLKRMLVELTGMHPDIVLFTEMDALMDTAVLPMFDVLDSLLDRKSRKVAAPRKGGKSVRNLASQVQLRYIETPELKALIEENNRLAESQGKHQFLILTGKERGIERFEAGLLRLDGNKQLTQVQGKNIVLNLQLIELAKAKKEKMQ